MKNNYDLKFEMYMKFYPVQIDVNHIYLKTGSKKRIPKEILIEIKNKLEEIIEYDN